MRGCSPIRDFEEDDHEPVPLGDPPPKPKSVSCWDKIINFFKRVFNRS